MNHILEDVAHPGGVLLEYMRLTVREQELLLYDWNNMHRNRIYSIARLNNLHVCLHNTEGIWTDVPIAVLWLKLNRSHYT